MITTLNNTCDEMRKHINLAKQETAPILDEASALMTARKEHEAKQDVLRAFKEHFIISDDDVSALTSSVEPVNDHFFEVLVRVKKIHDDCEVLLESENQTIGLELMEQTSWNLDAGFKKLYQWIQREFKTLDLEDPHISGSIRRALRVLAERPSLFQNCLDFFVEAREHTLSDAFHTALTEAAGGPERTGPAKPIEFSTHDLLRYLGDMLAWVHSTSVSEKESLEGLFVSDGDEIAKGIKAGKDSDPWSRLRQDEQDTGDGAETIFDGHKALNDLVNRNLTGICQTLRQRVEVAVRNNDDPVLVYKALHLLRFYDDIFSKLLGPESGLADTLQGLEAASYNHFEHLLREEAEGITDEPVPTDLSVPAFFITALDRLAVIMASATEMSSMDEINRLITITIYPFQNLSDEMASSIPDPVQKAVFRLNHGLALLSRSDIAPHIREGSTAMTRLHEAITNQKTELLDLQHKFLLRKSGLDPLLSWILALQSEGTKLATQPDDHANNIMRVQDAAAQLDAFLPAAQMDALDNIKQLSDKRLAKDITEAAIQRFCSDFERVVERLQRMDAEMDERRYAVVEEQTAALSREDGADPSLPAKPYNMPMLRFMPYFPRSTAEIRLLLS